MMEPGRYEKIKEVLHKAAGLEGAARKRYLDEACGDDAEMRQEIEALLSDEAGQTVSLFDRDSKVNALAEDALRSVVGDSADAVPRQIGPYTIVRQLGAGGMGVVFEAKQEKPVRRRVALKIIKLGMDTRQVMARFEAERQALAMMDHPHIARVLDAGATDTGRPYFVMELVDGIPITDFCNDNRLSLSERLHLFVDVCRAVQHAHQKGIIHRDIKPSNVLVTRVDEKATPKVIDFGVAKATEQRLTEATMFTEHGQFIGTPAYMSPEQADPLGVDIDTRSDIYSLGVLLYELLTGVTPFDTNTLRRAALDEIRRIIREDDPSRPSTRLSGLGAELDTVARQRSIEPKKLGTVLRGDLDWIIMKALEKDRTRRYETANGLAMDIQRYLSGEPVVAAPPSVAYRVRKFARRNKGFVLSATAVAVALLIGVIAFAWQAQIARTERDNAINAEKAEAEQRRVADKERCIAESQRNLAMQEAARATAMSNFVQEMLQAADPRLVGGSRDVTVLELLHKASDKAGRTLNGQPMIEAAARTFLGKTLCSLGQIDDGISELNRALELRRNTPDAFAYPQAETLEALGEVYYDKWESQASLDAIQQYLEIVNSLGEDRAADAAVGYVNLARAHSRLSQFAEADAALDKADEILDRLPTDIPSTRAAIACERAVLAKEWHGDWVAAETFAEQEVALRRQADNPFRLFAALNNLAVFKMTAGKLDDAEALLKEAIEAVTREFGEDNQMTASYTENLANVYYRKKEYDESIAILERVIGIREALFGPDSMPVAKTRMNMGSIAASTGDFARALELFDMARPVFRENAGEESVDYAVLLRSRGSALKGLNDLDGALREFQAALAIYDAVTEPTVHGRLVALQKITEIQCLQGQPEAAQRTADLALEALDPDKPAHAKWVKGFQDKFGKCGETPP